MPSPELSTEPVEFEVKARMAGKRIDAYLVSRFQDYSRCAIQKLIDARAVLVNDQPVKASYRVRQADRVRAWLPEITDEGPTPEDIPLDVVYEDPGFVVLNKAAGMVMHPAKGNWSGTVVNALQFHFDQLSTVGGVERPGIIHRLDRDTTGLVLVGREDKAHRALAAQFEERKVRKEYLAIVYGELDRDSDLIDRPIGLHPAVREKMAVRSVADGGKEATTLYEVMERFRGFTLVRCLPRTGRTHQVRVHMATEGCPIVADRLYASRAALTMGQVAGEEHPESDTVLIHRQALHAHRIEFEHPTQGGRLLLTAPLPSDMDRVLGALRKYRRLDHGHSDTRK